MLLRPGDLDRRVTIERPVAGEGFGDAGKGTWQSVATVWAQVQDALPSRGMAVDIGTTLTRPARLRMYWRADLPAGVRFVCGERILYVVSGPAELGRREGMEWLVAESLPGGNPA